MTVEAVQATTADGFTLRGERVRGDGTSGLLVHDVGEDIDAWLPIRAASSGAAGACSRSTCAATVDPTAPTVGARTWGARRRPGRDARAPRLGARHVCVVAAGYGAVLTLRAVERAPRRRPSSSPTRSVLVFAGPLDGVDPVDLRGGGLCPSDLTGPPTRDRDDALALQRSSIGWHGRRSASRRRLEALPSLRSEARERARQDRRPAQGADEASRPRRGPGGRGGCYQAETS